MRKSNVTDDEVGGLAYETYCKAVGGKAFSGDLLPTWAVLCKDEKKENLVVAWKRAGRAVASLVEKKLAVPVAMAAPAVTGPTVSAPPLPSSRALPLRTICCGSLTLSLKTGFYVCPCGDHKESI
jgi:hypothetical protein